MAAPIRRSPPRGFTLVEVLVALFIMAVLAGMAFRGVDALSHSKERALAATNRTLMLNTGMSQWETDVSQLVDTHVLPTPVMFNGATLRFVRQTPDGMTLVVWTLQDRRWQRWASAPVTRVSQLQDAFFRTQQWESIAGNAVTVLQDVDDFQIYLYNNGWSNVQSTQSTRVQSVTNNGLNNNNNNDQNNNDQNDDDGNGNGNGNGNNNNNNNNNNNVLAVTTTTNQPTGIRVLLRVPEGELMREKSLPKLG